MKVAKLSRWAAPQVEPVLAMLSLKYTSEHLSFGVLNIAAAPALAKHLRIALDPLTSRQLPTLILFDKGQEVGRIPQARLPEVCTQTGTARANSMFIFASFAHMVFGTQCTGSNVASAYINMTRLRLLLGYGIKGSGTVIITHRLAACRWTGGRARWGKACSGRGILPEALTSLLCRRGLPRKQSLQSPSAALATSAADFYLQPVQRLLCSGKLGCSIFF